MPLASLYHAEMSLPVGDESAAGGDGVSGEQAFAGMTLGVADTATPRGTSEPGSIVGRRRERACCRPAVGHWDGNEMELLDRYAYRPEFRPLLLAYLGAAPAHHVLDVGAGSAYLGRMIASSFPDSQVTCLDADPAMLAVARRMVESEGLEQRVAVVEGDAYDLPFEDATFDLVTSHLLLCILDEPGRALQEQIRVTRPGGTVSCVVCFCHTDRLPHYHGRSGLPGDHRIDALRQAFARAWRVGVRPQLLNVDHGVLSQDVAWHFRDAGLSDVNVNGHLAVVAPGDDRLPLGEGVDFAAAMHEAELVTLRLRRRDHAAELAEAGFSTENFDELLRLKEARLQHLRDRPDAVRGTMEVRSEALLLVRGKVPGPTDA